MRVWVLSVVMLFLLWPVSEARAGDEGKLSADEVEKVVRKKRRQWRKCGVHLEFRTKLRVKFKVSKNSGGTSRFEVEKPVELSGGSPVGDCLREVVKTMHFPKPGKSQSVRYTFVIKPIRDVDAPPDEPPPDAHLPVLPQEAILKEIAAHQASFDACTEMLEPDDPDALTIRAIFTIDMKGKPRNVSILHDIWRKEKVGGCVSGAVRKMRFPKEHKVTNVMYPFRIQR